MEETKVLYQIKTLEKLIARYFFHDDEINIDKLHPTPTQMQIIEYILNHLNEDIYQKDLENILNLRRATVSGVLQTMEKNNLIQRVAHSKDARAKKIILNQKAKEIFLRNMKKMQELENIVTQGIDNKDLETFSNVLNLMKKNLIDKYTTSK